MEAILADLWEKYPQEREVFENLRFEALEQKERAVQHSCLLALSVPALYTWYALGHDFPLFREYGRFIGTHRRFRQYAYLLAVSSTPFWLSQASQKRTICQLQRVDANRSATAQNYITPQKPIYYPYRLM